MKSRWLNCNIACDGDHQYYESCNVPNPDKVESMSKVPTEPQLEAAFEVLAWLERRLNRPIDLEARACVLTTREELKAEVDRCLSE